MKILKSANEIDLQFRRLIDECESCRIAVAWATVDFEAAEQLAANKSKIERMIVGTDFWHTHPKFIEKFLDHGNVKFMIQKAGTTFHPKVYFFKQAHGTWECILGSPNFTNSAFNKNSEVAVLIDDKDRDAPDAYREVMGMIDGYWNDPSSFNQQQLETYKTARTEVKEAKRHLREIAAGIRSLLPRLMTPERFIFHVADEIKKAIPDVDDRWGLRPPIMRTKHIQATEAVRQNGLRQPQLRIHLFLCPNENRCEFEVENSRVDSERRYRVADSLRQALSNFWLLNSGPPRDTVIKKKGQIIAEYPLDVQQILDNGNGTDFSERIFRTQAERVVAFFKSLDHALVTVIANWSPLRQ
jgi:HKD family nuclease